MVHINVLAGLTLNLWPHTSSGPSGLPSNPPLFPHSIHSLFFGALASHFTNKIVSRTQLPYPRASFKLTNLPLYFSIDSTFLSVRMGELSIILKPVHPHVPWTLPTAFTQAIIPSPSSISIAECYEYIK